MCENRAQACKEPAKPHEALLLLQKHLSPPAEHQPMFCRGKHFLLLKKSIVTCGFSFSVISTPFLTTLWTSFKIQLTLIKLSVMSTLSEGPVSLKAIDVCVPQSPLVTKDEGTSVTLASGLDVCHFLFAQTCDTFYYSASGNISNEHYFGPSGLGVLAGLNASGLCAYPQAKHGSFKPSNAMKG